MIKLHPTTHRFAAGCEGGIYYIDIPYLTFNFEKHQGPCRVDVAPLGNTVM